MAEKFKEFHSGMIRGLGISLAILIIIIFSYFISIFTPLDILKIKFHKLENQYILTQNVKPDLLTETDKRNLKYCLHNQFIVPPDQIIGNITNYYNSMLTFLLGLIALLSFLAVLYIRSSSKEHAEDLIDKYLESNSFKSKIEDEAEKIRSELDQQYTSIYELKRKLTQLINRVDDKLEFLDALKIPEPKTLEGIINGGDKKE